VVGFKRKGQHVAGTSSNSIVQMNATRDGFNIVLYATYMLMDFMVDGIVLVLFCTIQTAININKLVRNADIFVGLLFQALVV